MQAVFCLLILNLIKSHCNRLFLYIPFQKFMFFTTKLYEWLKDNSVLTDIVLKMPSLFFNFTSLANVAVKRYASLILSSIYDFMMSVLIHAPTK